MISDKCVPLHPHDVLICWAYMAWFRPSPVLWMSSILVLCLTNTLRKCICPILMHKELQLYWGFFFWYLLQTLSEIVYQNLTKIETGKNFLNKNFDKRRKFPYNIIVLSPSALQRPIGLQIKCPTLGEKGKCVMMFDHELNFCQPLSGDPVKWRFEQFENQNQHQ